MKGNDSIAAFFVVIAMLLATVLLVLVSNLFTPSPTPMAPGPAPTKTQTHTS